jgi:hypothetical protein
MKLVAESRVTVSVQHNFTPTMEYRYLWLLRIEHVVGRAPIYFDKFALTRIVQCADQESGSTQDGNRPPCTYFLRTVSWLCNGGITLFSHSLQCDWKCS